MYQIEIKLNKDKIEKSSPYSYEKTYNTLIKMFDYFKFKNVSNDENTLIFPDNDKNSDYSAFGKLIIELLGKHWFVDYVDEFNLYEYDNFDENEAIEKEDLLS